MEGNVTYPRKFKLKWSILTIIMIGAVASTLVWREHIARQICKTKWLPLKLRNAAKDFLGQYWMVVFVHGTYGSMLSLLDLPTLNNDRVAGSKYKLIVDKMRNEPLFWKDQAVLQRGLVFVDPQKVVYDEAEAQSGAFILAKSFLAIEQILGTRRNSRAYTFGWSGLLSQHRRRKEAIRFYNQLCAEVERLEREDGIIDPKIEIISHSHGGNLSLNLAAVYHVLHHDLERFLDAKTGAVQEFMDEMATLKAINDPERRLDGQHGFDYWPVRDNLKIERLLMLGTPVQAKTYKLASSEVFGEVFNIYSEEDGVQKMDYVSCCSDTQNRTFKIDPEMCASKIYQVRMSVCSDQVLKGAVPQTGKKTVPELSWWQVLLGMRDISRASCDPTHKELWFLVKDESQTGTLPVIKPLPIAVYTPLIVDAVENCAGNHGDLDVDFSVQGGRLLIFVAPHESGNFRLCRSVPYAKIRNLAQEAYPYISTEDDSVKIRVFMQQLMEEWRQMQVNG